MTPTFSNLGTLLKIDIKNCPLLGKLLSVWRTVSVLPKSALSAWSAQIVENSHSFFNVSYTWYKSLYWILLFDYGLPSYHLKALCWLLSLRSSSQYKTDSSITVWSPWRIMIPKCNNLLMQLLSQNNVFVKEHPKL